MSKAHATTAAQSSYEQSFNTQRLRLLDVLGMNVHYANCLGSELFTSDSAHILDFNSGYCVHNPGRNHPDVILLLKDELDRNGPAMLQGARAGALKDKRWYIQAMQEPFDTEPSAEVHELTARVYGTLAIAVGRYTIKATSKGQDLSSHTRFTAVWRKQEHKWQALAHHATRIDE